MTAALKTDKILNTYDFNGSHITESCCSCLYAAGGYYCKHMAESYTEWF
ncbi:MAG TPA: hypothetical protein DCM49_06795 [Lachnospiraceae bacterium]|nr:hypothetical protein [Lachnospiraceae bacterium]